jgi:hypothetical protein
MPCIRCVGLEAEVELNVIDEVICTFCGQHYYKTTNHNGLWRIYVATDCSICGGLSSTKFPNTDNYNNQPEYHINYYCGECNLTYSWNRSTGWELQKEIKKPTMDVSTPTYIKLKGPDPFKDVKLPSTREMYESAYWAFVGSDTGSENETTWYNTMLDRVTMDLQPVGDWHSWVPEPVVAKPVSMGTKIFDGVLKGIQMTLLAAFVAICMLAALGVIK